MYPPINKRFSRELAEVIKIMLQQKPKARPSAEKLFSSNIIQKKIEDLSLETERKNERVNS
jgi:hypothetical protein